MKAFFPSLLVASLLLASTAQAQVTFGIGPQVGLVVSTAHYETNTRSYQTTERVGLEAGIQGSLTVGHFSLQPAVLYTQKGFGIRDKFFTYGLPNAAIPAVPTSIDEQYRLNYLTIPLHLAYATGQHGQGFQVMAGGYLGLLLGGDYSFNDSYQTALNQTLDVQLAGDITPGNTYATNLAATKVYSRKVDAGLQGGLGYRLGGALFQATYNLGLTNVGADYLPPTNMSTNLTAPRYYNRSFQFSLSYLFGPKS